MAEVGDSSSDRASFFVGYLSSDRVYIMIWHVTRVNTTYRSYAVLFINEIGRGWEGVGAWRGPVPYVPYLQHEKKTPVSTGNLQS
jgi:hypothetical protein